MARHLGISGKRRVSHQRIKLPSHSKLRLKAKQLQARIDKLQADNAKLKEFARHVIRIECWGFYEYNEIDGLDGAELQDMAERLGLIEPHTATADDVDDESDYEVGDKIFKFTELLKGGVE